MLAWHAAPTCVVCRFDGDPSQYDGTSDAASLVPFHFAFAGSTLDRHQLACLRIMDGLGFGFHELGPPMTLADFRKLFNGPLIHGSERLRGRSDSRLVVSWQLIVRSSSPRCVSIYRLGSGCFLGLAVVLRQKKLRGRKRKKWVCRRSWFAKMPSSV